MAYHVRRQLRDAVVDAVTNLATTAHRVFTDRIDPLTSGDLPCLEVSTPTEDSVDTTIHAPTVVERSVTVEITAIVRGSSLADSLDAIAAEVETALSGSVSVGGIPVPLTYDGADLDLSNGLEQKVGRLTMRYRAILYSLASTPDALAQA